MSKGPELSAGESGQALTERQTAELLPQTQRRAQAETIEQVGDSLPVRDVRITVASSQYAILDSPTRIGRYVVLRHLGQGGMGTVFSAYDPDLDRKIAVKVVREDARKGEIARERLLKEAKAMARISHPNVVHVYEVGEDREGPLGQIFIAMEFVPGTDLVEWQRRNPVRDAVALDRCLRIYLQAAAGLEAAHHSGLIHRDFKPDNVLIGDDGRARVTDFGIARAHDDQGGREVSAPSSRSLRTSGERLTLLGAILGTPGYMSPEQVRGEQATARSDQFGFCAALFEAIFGVQPFVGTTIEEYARSVLTGKPQVRTRTPYGFEVPIVIKRALLRGLSLDPSARYSSMQELTVDLSKGLLPDADSESMRQTKRRFLYVLLTSWAINIWGVWAFVGTFQKSDLRPPLLISGGLLSITATVVWFLRKAIYQQPSYRRLSYFILSVLGYLVVGRSLGLLLGMPADRFLIQETVALGALFASEMPKAGRRYGWLVLLCVMSVALQILFPDWRRVHLNLIYALMLFFTVYLRFQRGEDAPAKSPDSSVREHERRSET